MAKIDLTPFEQAAETERRLAHERIERLTWERNFYAVNAFSAWIVVAVAVGML